MSAKSTAGKFGTLLVKVVETRDFKSAYCAVHCDAVHRFGAAKKKNEANAKYDESFTMFVHHNLKNKQTSKNCKNQKQKHATTVH